MRTTAIPCGRKDAPLPYRSLVLSAALGLAPAVLAAAHAQTLKITVAATPPSTVTFVGTFKKNVVSAIDRRLARSGKDFRIEWTHAYSGKLATPGGIFEAVGEGIGGAGLIRKSSEPGKLPLEAYAIHMPFASITRKQIAEIDARLRRKFPALNRAYRRHNHVFIASGVDDSRHLFTSFPVARVADLRNRKLGSRGAFAQWLRGTGAIPVEAWISGSRTDIGKGAYEGYPTGIIPGYVHKTYLAAPYFTRVDFGPTPATAITFNADIWKKIPAHGRRIIREEAANWTNYQNTVDLVKRSRYLGIMKRKGVEVSTLSRSERRKWASVMPNIAREWARRLDRDGLPGTRLMTEYMDGLRARGIRVARHWDRE